MGFLHIIVCNRSKSRAYLVKTFAFNTFLLKLLHIESHRHPGVECQPSVRQRWDGGALDL
jgi:hypothetical protein